jgi:hypothetical protein
MRFGYEHRSLPLLSRRKFYGRLGQHVLLAGTVLLFSLVIGMAGYMRLARMDAVDAFLNTAMLLGGMGPVGDLPNDAAKIFAGIFAIYAGVVFIATAGILIAPVAHRLLHKFHIEGAEDAQPGRGKARPNKST